MTPTEPEGWVTVPREPTEAMQVAGVTVHVETARTAEGEGRCLTPSLIYRAMLEAAPPAPTVAANREAPSEDEHAAFNRLNDKIRGDDVQMLVDAAWLRRKVENDPDDASVKVRPATASPVAALSDADVERMAKALTEHAYASRGMQLLDAEWAHLREGCMDGMRAALAVAPPAPPAPSEGLEGLRLAFRYHEEERADAVRAIAQSGHPTRAGNTLQGRKERFHGKMATAIQEAIFALSAIPSPAPDPRLEALIAETGEWLVSNPKRSTPRWLIARLVAALEAGR